MRYTVTIDGMNFSTIDEFWDEMEKLLTKNLSWKTGHNMHAFHDLLRGGFGMHEMGEGIDFYWINADKSRKDLGYEATALYFEKIFQKCHPTNRQTVMLRMKEAKACEGETLFDIIVDEILDKSDLYDHSLQLDSEYLFNSNLSGR